MKWKNDFFFYLTQPRGPFDGLFYKTGGNTKGQQAEKTPGTTQIQPAQMK